MTDKRATLVLGTMAVLAAGPVQLSHDGLSHAEPSPVAPAPHHYLHPRHYPERFRSDGVVGEPIRPTVPLTARSLAANKIKIEVLDRHGQSPATADAQRAVLLPLAGGDWMGANLKDGHAEGSLPVGDYAVYAYVRTPEVTGDGSNTLVYVSKVTVSGDSSVVLDARRGKPVDAVVDREGARAVAVTVLITQKLGSRVEPTAVLEGPNAYITPTGADSGLTYRIQARLTSNGADMGSPYVYNVAAMHSGIPANPGLRVRTKDLAAVRTQYASQGGPACAGTHAGVDWGTGLNALSYAGLGAVPTTRTEYFTPKFTWTVGEGLTSADCGFSEGDIEQHSRTERFPQAGAYTRQWNNAPFGPSAGLISWGSGHEPTLVVRMLSQVDGQSQIAPYPHTTGTSTLRDAKGTVVATSDKPGRADNWPRPSPGNYRLTVDAQRNAPWSDLTTRQQVVWDFTVQNAKKVTLPTIRYRTTLDSTNRARAGAKQTITLSVDGGKKVGPITLQASYDDGRTWHQVDLKETSGGWSAAVPNPATGYVSLRAATTGVDQTVIRAYGIKR